MSSPTRRRQALLGFVLAITGLVVLSDAPGSAQAVSSFEIEWEQPGVVPAYYELCINGECRSLFARPTTESTWRAPLPPLPPGEHHLVLRACGVGACVPGTPDLFVRIVRPNPKTPPIIVR
jgi:hypothetical protein